jgi:hypothetical protein
MPVLEFTFDGPALDPALDVFKPAALAAVSFAAGRARLEPVQGGNAADGSFWFDGFTGFLVSAEITGDFVAIATFDARDTDGVSLPPVDGSFRICALAVHDPDRATNLDYVHGGFGCVDSGLAAEWKTTVASSSTFGSIAWPTAGGQVRVTRVGQVFTFDVRADPEDPWTELQVLDRTAAPLPATVDVGLTSYCSDPDHEIVMLVDELSITQAPAELVAGGTPEDTMDADFALRTFGRGRNAGEPTRTPITVSTQDTLLGPAAAEGVLVMPVGGFLIPADDVALTFYSGDPATDGVAITGAIAARAGVPIPLGPWLHPDEGAALYVRRGTAVAAAGAIHTLGL